MPSRQPSKRAAKTHPPIQDLTARYADAGARLAFTSLELRQLDHLIKLYRWTAGEALTFGCHHRSSVTDALGKELYANRSARLAEAEALHSQLSASRDLLRKARDKALRALKAHPDFSAPK